MLKYEIFKVEQSFFHSESKNLKKHKIDKVKKLMKSSIFYKNNYLFEN